MADKIIRQIEDTRANITAGKRTKMFSYDTTNDTAVYIKADGTTERNLITADSSNNVLNTLGNVVVADGAYLGLGASKGRIVFDDDTTDEIAFMDCNVGIGTDTPGATLHVNGGSMILGATDPVLFFRDTDCVDSDNNAKIIVQATDTGSGTEDIDFLMRQQIAGIDTTFFFSDADGIITLGDGTRNINLSAGLVGIGTATPSVRLHVNGGNAIIGFSSPALLFRDTDCADTDNNATIEVAATKTGSGEEDVDVYVRQQIAGALTTFLGSDADGIITLGDGTRNINLSAGSVGIGTNAPSAKLDVNGSIGIRYNNQLEFYGNGATAVDTNGNWRTIIDSGTGNLLRLKREAGAWVTKETIS
jgi:hypothetical protein